MKYLALLLILLFAGCSQSNVAALPPGLYTQVTTPRGVIIGELYYKQCPMTVANYVGLAEGTLGPRKGASFYKDNPFHRVVPNFVIQGGSGAAGDPDGDAGYSFPDEIVPGLRHDSVGVIQMANDGPDTNGSQWCMMTASVNRLNYNHTVFGHVIQGMEVLPKIQQGDRMQVQILRIGPEAQAFKADQKTFDALVAQAKRYSGPKQPGTAAWFDDPDHLLPADPPRAQAFNYKLGNVQRFINHRVIARLYAKTPPEAGANLDAFLTTLAQQNGVAAEGALVVYFHDTRQWRLRITGNARNAFIAGPRRADGSKILYAVPRTYDQAVTDFLALVRSEQPKLQQIARNAMTQPAPFTDAQLLKFEVDSVLDNLIFCLEPPHPPISRVSESQR